MLKLSTGEPARIKKSTMLTAILVLVLVYSMLQIFIPTIFGNVEAGEAGSEVYVEHVVSGGETLWDIAVMHRPDADPRAVVWEIRQVNDIGAVIYPGQVVRVPK
jgi:nucleoid-associated protein YgaU